VIAQVVVCIAKRDGGNDAVEALKVNGVEVP
jgi:hypothetical protein